MNDSIATATSHHATSTLAVPEFVASLRAQQYVEWSDLVSTDQLGVDIYTGMFRDPNPKHQASSENIPILPGFFVLSLVPGYLFNHLPRVVGRSVVIRDIQRFKFSTEVKVGDSVKLRYMPLSAKVRGGIVFIRAEVEIALSNGIIAAKGIVSALLV